MRVIFGFLAGLIVSTQALALDLDSLSNADAVGGLKDALAQGSAAAVSKLGVQNGFLGNDKVKIPLPDALKRVEGGLRLLGMQKQANSRRSSSRSSPRPPPESVSRRNTTSSQARARNWA